MAMGLNSNMIANAEMHTMSDVLVEQSIDDLIKAALSRKCLELARSDDRVR